MRRSGPAPGGLQCAPRRGPPKIGRRRPPGLDLSHHAALADDDGIPQHGPIRREGQRVEDLQRLRVGVPIGAFTVACWRAMWKPDREIQTPTSPGGGRGPKWSEPVWSLSAPVGRIVKPLIHEGRCDRLAVLLGSTPVQDLGTPRC
jgi:hypothetical protein